jgi:hypothetical protein
MSKKTLSLLLNLGLLPLKPLEKYFLKRSVEKLPPICIIGPARSGTTLVHQCLVARFQLGYVPKFVSFFPENCLLAASLWEFINKEKHKTNSFESQYGKGKGLAGIHQGHTIWKRWFKWDRPNAPLSDTEREIFKGTVFGLGERLGTPFSFKWPGLCAHFSELSQCLSNAFFIVIDRDTLSMAKSIYKGRVDLKGSPNFSISRSPDGRHLRPVEDGISDIFSYIYAVRKEIASTIKNMNSNRYLVITYENLCTSPTKIIDRIGNQYKAWAGIPLKINTDLPHTFKISSGPNLGENIEFEINSKYVIFEKLDVDSLGQSDFE